MTKADICEVLHRKLGNVSKKECADIVDTFFSVLKESIVNEGKVKISRFGNFEVLEKRARKGRNPKTGEAMVIKARRVLKFRTSAVLDLRLNPKD